jgi:hypothetical protein
MGHGIRQEVVGDHRRACPKRPAGRAVAFREGGVGRQGQSLDIVLGLSGNGHGPQRSIGMQEPDPRDQEAAGIGRDAAYIFDVLQFGERSRSDFVDF